MRVEHTTSESIWPAAGCEASRANCGTALVDAETRLFWHGTDGGIHEQFLGGLITGSLIGVVGTLLALMIVVGVRGPENTTEVWFRTESFLAAYYFGCWRGLLHARSGEGARGGGTQARDPTVDHVAGCD